MECICCRLEIVFSFARFKGGSHRFSSNQEVKAAFDAAPDRRAASVPFLNRMRVGTARMPRAAESFRLSSSAIASAFTKSIRPSKSAASSSKTGDSAAHGGQDFEKKSTRTGCGDSEMARFS